jgi:peptidoglycan/LPS O-acetylase OafA/YrhL
MSSLSYRPEIDGLRALAVLPVVCFHFNRELLPGGFVGVDVFFVISGYLITALIQQEVREGTFTFRSFWLRRIRRIVPALATMVLGVSAAGWAVLYAPDVRNLGHHGAAALLSGANLSHWRAVGNYWGEEAANSPLLHTWSLSVEEQFYLLYPLLLVFLWRRLPGRVPALVALGVAASVGLYLLGAHLGSAATFYLLPTRAWELGAGALAALLPAAPRQATGSRTLLSLLGMGALLLSYFLLREENGTSPLLPLPVLGTAVLLRCSDDPRDWTNRLLSLRGLTYVGRTSYSLYLWHWPILVFSRQIFAGAAQPPPDAAVLGVVVLAAILSYHCVEVPARRKTSSLPGILSLLLAGLALTVALFLRTPDEDVARFSRTQWHGNQFNCSPGREWPEAMQRRMRGIELPPGEEPPPSSHAGEGIVRRHGADTPAIVVLGDSHALMWAKLLEEIAGELRLTLAFFTADGTPPFFALPPRRGARSTEFFSVEQKYEFDLARLRCLERWRPRVIVIACKWNQLADVGLAAALLEHFGRLGARVLLLEQPPVLGFGDRNAPQYLSFREYQPAPGRRQFIRRVDDEAYRRGAGIVRQFAAAYPHCAYVPVADLFIEGDRSLVLVGDEVLYIDDDHLSYAGARLAKHRVTAGLAALLGPPAEARSRGGQPVTR